MALMERILALDVQLIEVDSVMTSGRDGPLRVALEAIGGNGRRRRDVAEKEPSHISLLEADAVLQSRSSSALCSDKDQGFARAPPMGSAAATHICFIDLDVIVQPVSTLTSGASPQLVHPCPRGLVRPKPEDSLKLLRTDAVLANTHLPDGAKPHSEGLPGLVQNRSCGDAGLVTALSALEPSVREFPDPVMVTLPASGPSTPPDLNEVAPTRLLVWKHRLECGRRRRKRTPQVFLVHLVPPAVFMSYLYHHLTKGDTRVVAS